VSKPDPVGTYEFEIRGDDVRIGGIGHGPEGRTFKRNRSGTLEKHKPNEELTATNVGSNEARVYIRKTAWAFTLDPPIEINDVSQLRGAGSLDSLSYSTSGTSAEQLPDNEIPDGLSVVVRTDTSNSGIVYVGGSSNQKYPLLSNGEGVSLKVRNTNDIYVQTPNGGDTVYALWESDR